MKSLKSVFSVSVCDNQAEKVSGVNRYRSKSKSLQREIAIIKPALNHWKEVACTFEKPSLQTSTSSEMQKVNLKGGRNENRQQ